MSRIQPRNTYTLVVIRNENTILLGRKKILPWVGKWCGFGGRVHRSETLTQAASRCVRHQCGLEVEQLKKVGAFEIELQNDPKIKHTHVFLCDAFRGEAAETDHAVPGWFNIDEVPFLYMLPDYQVWLPDLIYGITFHGYFHYQNSTLIKKTYKLLEIPSMDLPCLD